MSLRMIGTASEPTVEQTVETVATCKQQTTINIKISNWLDIRQAFNATFTILQPSGGQGIHIQVGSLWHSNLSVQHAYIYIISSPTPFLSSRANLAQNRPDVLSPQYRSTTNSASAVSGTSAEHTRSCRHLPSSTLLEIRPENTGLPPSH